MKLPTFRQFRGIVIVVNTLLPILLALSLIWMYAFHFKPLIEEFQSPFFSDLKSIETLLDKYRTTEIVAAEAYEPIARLSEQIALLSISVCQSSQLEKILSLRDETLAVFGPPNDDSYSSFVQARFERARNYMTLEQSAQGATPKLSNRFSELVITADARRWFKEQLGEKFEKPGRRPPRDPSDSIVNPQPIKLDFSEKDLSVEVEALTSTLNEHAGKINSLTQRIQPLETCERVESHFQAIFFVFGSVFALFDEIKIAFSDFKKYLDVNVEAVWRKASSLYQVVKYTSVAIMFWLIVSYVTWVFNRLERGWTMIAGLRVDNSVKR